MGLGDAEIAAVGQKGTRVCVATHFFEGVRLRYGVGGKSIKRKRLAKCLTCRSYRGAVLEYNFSLFAAEMLVGGPASIPQTIRVLYLRGFVSCDRGLFFVSHPSEPLPPPSSPSWASVSVRESRACSDLASVTSHVFSSRSTVNFRLSLL